MKLLKLHLRDTFRISDSNNSRCIHARAAHSANSTTDKTNDIHEHAGAREVDTQITRERRRTRPFVRTREMQLRAEFARTAAVVACTCFYESSTCHWWTWGMCVCVRARNRNQAAEMGSNPRCKQLSKHIALRTQWKQSQNCHFRDTSEDQSGKMA